MYRQRHLWGYRSRIRTLNPNPKTHPNPNPIFFKINPNQPEPFFERKQKRHRNIGQHRVIFIGYLFTKGRGRLYERPISRKGTGSYSDTPYSDKCFWKGATNSKPNRILNPIPSPSPNPNLLHYPFRNVGIAVVGVSLFWFSARRTFLSEVVKLPRCWVFMYCWRTRMLTL